MGVPPTPPSYPGGGLHTDSFQREERLYVWNVPTLIIDVRKFFSQGEVGSNSPPLGFALGFLTYNQQNVQKWCCVTSEISLGGMPLPNGPTGTPAVGPLGHYLWEPSEPSFYAERASSHMERPCGDALVDSLK